MTPDDEVRVLARFEGSYVLIDPQLPGRIECHKLQCLLGANASVLLGNHFGKMKLGMINSAWEQHGVGQRKQRDVAGEVSQLIRI